jgi:serine/threonine-protein kinase
MTPEEARLWREADALLKALLDLPTVERARRVASLAPGLRNRVVRLLDADAKIGPLDSPHFPEPVPPEAIGPWRIIGTLGRGGMSVVYRAEREIEGATQQAAVKLITLGALAGFGRGRFRREHALLARLSHPGIVGLLDAGVLPDGTPYLATSLVEGLRIDDWCRTRALGPRETVILFLQACDAVAYAHRHLVIHRDLKPGNILVDHGGHLHLLDFGIARMLDASEDAQATGTAARALTPQFAAPEQFEGRDSGVAVDVFGLGAVLYHLLVGRAPRGERAMANSPITLPSRAAAACDVRPPELRLSFRRALRGDLDAILMRALAERPEQRYPDVAALRADLAAWLDRRPVTARRGGPVGRLALAIRRNPLAAAMSAAALLALTAGTLVTLDANRALERRAAELEAVAAFQADMLRAIQPDRLGRELREALDAAVETADPQAAALAAPALDRVNFTDLAVGLLDSALLTPSQEAAWQRFQGQPLVLATLLQTLAVSHRSLGHLDRAMPLQSEALAQRRAHLGEAHPLTLTSLREHLRLLRRRAPDRGGEAAHRELWAQHARHLGADHTDTLRARHDLAEYLLESGNDAAAEPLFRELVEPLAQLPSFTDHERVALLANLARSVSGQARYAEAEPMYREALDLGRALLGADHPVVLTLQNNLAYTVRQLDRPAEAEALYAVVYERRRQRLGELHPETLVVLNNLGAMKRLREDHEAVEVLSRRVFEGMRRAQGPDHETTLTMQFNLAASLLSRSGSDEAVSLIEDAITRWHDAGHGPHPVVAMAQRNLARVAGADGRLDDAEHLLLAAWNTARAVGHQRLKAALAADLVKVYEERGEDAEVLALWTDRAASP